jgi:AcrR family transcriptional regulator
VQEILSLRERNRRHTWNVLHETAAALAFVDGPASVSVEAIVARAGVSQRTFFNYFATKDDAMVGFREATLSPEATAAFRTSDLDLLERTVRLIVAAFGSSTLPEHVGGRRVALVQRHPELRARVDAHAASIEALVAPLIAEQFGVAVDELSVHVPLTEDDARPMDGKKPRGERSEAGKQATALLMLAATIVRFAYKTDLAAMATNDKRTISDAIAPFRHLLRSTS